MRSFFSSMPILVVAALIGCGPPPVVESAVPPSSDRHGGILIPLADKQAYVELLNGKRERSGATSESTLVAYVLQPDQQSAISPVPTEVVVKLDTSAGPSQVPLRSEPDTADPVGATRFVSKPGDFELSQRGGEVTVTLGGKTLTGKFRGPR